MGELLVSFVGLFLTIITIVVGIRIVKLAIKAIGYLFDSLESKLG